MVSGKFDSFYHLGWTNTDREGRRDQAKQDLNIQYSLDSLKTAKKIGCDVFLGAGSQAEYGRYDVPISEEFEPMPETAYGRSKLLAGKVTSEFASKIGIKHVWTRIFSAYGPHDAASTMIMYCIDRLLKNEKVGLTACTQTWDYLYCMDAARAIVSVAEKGKNNRVYNIGSGIGRELKEYVKIITDLMEVRQEIEFGVIKAPEGGLMNLTADISRISRDTGFNPLVGFEEGIKETIKWHKENYQ
jgi:nucleoside-diphosphate-sugar epimerase